MVFQANGTELSAVVDAKSRFWRKRQAAVPADFKAGEELTVNVKSNEKGVQLREVSDSESTRWLGFIRKGVMMGTLTGGDKTGIFVKFADGSRFHYRMTDKAQIFLGKEKATTSGLRQGMVVFIKSRLTSTLDSSVQTLSDTPLVTPLPKDDEPGTVVGTVESFDAEKKLLTILSGDESIRVLVDASSQGDASKLTPQMNVWMVVERTESGVARVIEFHSLSSVKR